MKRIICYLFGHNYFKVFEKDNGYSQWGDHRCSRCGHTYKYQNDYSLNT